MQNLFFKKFLLGLIVVNSSLLFSSEHEITEYNKYGNSDYFKPFDHKDDNFIGLQEVYSGTVNSCSNIYKRYISIDSISKDKYKGFVSTAGEKCNKQSNNMIELFEKSSESNKIDRDNEDKIKQHLNNIHLDDIQFYFNNSDLNNDQIKTLYYTIKHINNNFYKEHYEKTEHNNDDALLFIKLFLSMIKDIEKRQELLFTIQNLNIKIQELKLDKLAQEMQALKLSFQKQELNRMIQESFEREQALQEEEEKEPYCSCVLL